MVTKVFQAEVSRHHNLIMPQEGKALDLLGALNFRNLSPSDFGIEFHFAKSKRKVLANPKATIMLSALAFEGALAPVIFPHPNRYIELLPFTVDGADWIAVNCLKTTKLYDEDESVIYRSSAGQIYSVNHLVLRDPSLFESEIFVIEDSNRSRLYALPSFVDRLKKLDLSGLNFKEIGILRD